MNEWCVEDYLELGGQTNYATIQSVLLEKRIDLPLVSSCVEAEDIKLFKGEVITPHTSAPPHE